MITAKHHDAFRMFDSKQTAYDIVDATMCLVNGRVGNHLGDYASTDDNAIPAEQPVDMDWETPATNCRRADSTAERRAPGVMGRWLEQNGALVYGTRPGPLQGRQPTCSRTGLAPCA